MGKKILTLDNLYQFFVQQNKTFSFNSKESGEPIVVSVPGNFAVEENDMPGMMKTRIKVCHIDTNRNGSHISKENMEKAMPSIKYRPLLAYIHQLEDGTWDFYAHNMEIVEDENGEEQINYIEKQIGCFTADEPYLEYDKEQDKTYVMAYGVIPEDYTKAADIIRRKGGTKVSCELVINSLEYNAKEKYLDLTDFYFGGTTLLGCDENGNEIGEGMAGARLDISDFCHKEPTFNYQDKLIETLEKLNFTLENFNKSQSNEEGGEEEMNMFEKLLEQYGKTAEDVTFEIDGLSDEELEAKFKEVFGEEDEVPAEPIADENPEEPAVEPEEEPVASDPEPEEPTSEGDGDVFAQRQRYVINENGNMQMNYEISHEDIRFGLSQLLCQYEEVDNEWYWITNVYDDYFVFENWYGNKYYKQGFSVDGDNVAFNGERIELFKMMLTESEKIAIDEMRSNYSTLEAKYNELAEFKSKYDADVLKAQKDAIFAKEEYGCLKTTDGFKALVADAEKYSVEGLSTKLDLLFAAYVKSTGEFSVKKTDEKKTSLKFSTKTADKANKRPYGSLFDTE